MGIFRRADGGALAALAAQCLVGRSPLCTLRIDTPKASREHARIHFVSDASPGWMVRDLGSSNGTFVNGERLAAGGTRAIARGDRVGFGDTDAWWELADASPPVAMARRLDDEGMMAAEGGVLALPSADAPLVSVLEEAGAWVIEIDGMSRPVSDGEVVTLAGAAFMLHLPVMAAPTAEAPQDTFKRGFSDVELRFRVSSDEEHVEVTVATPEQTHVLAPRAHHYTWLQIARARLRDCVNTGLIEAQRGWVQLDDLMRSLRLDETHINVEIHRIRQGVAAIGVPDGANVIERRRRLRQLRLGTERVVIVTA